MGRTEPSVGQAPASFRREARAKRAKTTINQLIPSLLPTHPRARKGIEQTELIVEPQPLQSTDTSPASDDDTGPRLSLRVADTLTAARSLLDNHASSENATAHRVKKSKVAVLNMASPLSPGGGFLNGASSQEESLCMRTTLLPSLKDRYYRLPELGGVYTPDVLVFRDEGSDEVLAKTDRYFVDCISAAMLRGPETERNEEGWAGYAHEKDRELVLQKMRTVMRICQLKDVTHIVLGAWGCGAYGNPVNEVASAWRKVLCPRDDLKGKKKKRETWSGVEEVIFAIKDEGMADSFGAAFGPGLEGEDRAGKAQGDEGDNCNMEQGQGEDLRARIQELEMRIETTTNLNIKEGLNLIKLNLIKRVPIS
jgi:uncharacterized protein (TIGR02452 family)